MTEQQVLELLQQLEQDPLTPLTEEQKKELSLYASHNPQAQAILQFAAEQQQTDLLLRRQFARLREDLSRLPVPAPPATPGLATSQHRTVFFYALPVAALLVLAVGIFLWQKPDIEPPGQVALDTPLPPQSTQLPGDVELANEDVPAPDVSDKPAEKKPAGEKTTVAQQQLLAKKDTAETNRNLDITSLGDPAATVATRSLTTEKETSPGKPSENLSKEEQTRLRQKADALWKTIRQNPDDEKAKKELRDILQKLGDKEGLRQLEMY